MVYILLPYFVVTEIEASCIRAFGRKGVGANNSYSTNFPIGVTVTADKDIVVCDDSSVKIFNWDGQIKKILGINVSNIEYDVVLH